MQQRLGDQILCRFDYRRRARGRRVLGPVQTVVRLQSKAFTHFAAVGTQQPVCIADQKYANGFIGAQGAPDSERF